MLLQTRAITQRDAYRPASVSLPTRCSLHAVLGALRGRSYKPVRYLWPQSLHPRSRPADGPQVQEPGTGKIGEQARRRSQEAPLALVAWSLVARSALRRSAEDALAGRCYGFATAYIRHSPGTPFNSWAPWSSKVIPEPATRSFTVCDTSTWPAAASADTRAPIETAEADGNRTRDPLLRRYR